MEEGSVIAIYVDILGIVYGGIVELYKVYTQEQNKNIDTRKLGVVYLLDKGEVVCCDEDVVAQLYEGMVKFLDKNNKDDFDADFILAHPLEQLLE